MYTLGMYKLFLKTALLSLVLSLVILVPYAQASEDHDEARVLSESGEIKPLNDILIKVKKEISGTVLAVELELEDDIIVYEIEILLQQGIVKNIYVDARTGDIISIKGGD